MSSVPRALGLEGDQTQQVRASLQPLEMGEEVAVPSEKATFSPNKPPQHCSVPFPWSSASPLGPYRSVLSCSPV